MGTQYQRMYNPATVETLSGTVESVDVITPGRGVALRHSPFVKKQIKRPSLSISGRDGILKGSIQILKKVTKSRFKGNNG